MTELRTGPPGVLQPRCSCGRWRAGARERPCHLTLEGPNTPPEEDSGAPSVRDEGEGKCIERTV